MKSYLKSASPQLNLALLDRALAELPQNEQQELSLALVELLVKAATPGRSFTFGSLPPSKCFRTKRASDGSMAWPTKRASSAFRRSW